jgi:hypothetical protein
MTRRIWAAIACFIVLGLSLAGFTGVGDEYDTHAPVYAYVEHVVPKARYDQAEAYTRAVQRDDVPVLDAMSDPSILNKNFYTVIPTLAKYYPAGAPRSAGPLQYGVTAYTDGRRFSFVVINHVYADGSAMLATTTFNEANGKVIGFNIHLMTPADLKSIRFDPLAANGTQAAFLAMALAIIAFTTFTLYRCLATPKLRWKWLWFLFITAGIASLRFNWMTQVVQAVPIDIHWGAAGIYQLIFEPATLYLNLPIGALVFWLTARSRAAKVKAAA